MGRVTYLDGRMTKQTSKNKDRITGEGKRNQREEEVKEERGGGYEQWEGWRRKRRP